MQTLITHRPSRVVLIGTLLSMALATCFLFMPRGGIDLSAQVAHAEFFRNYSWRPIDFRWFGGTQQFGYSLVSPVVMLVFGTRGTGALAVVLSTFALATIFVRTKMPRPLLGTLLGSVCFLANVIGGRITFALGVAFGLAGLAALTSQRKWFRGIGAVSGAFLASAASPVAGLFVGLAAAALFLTKKRRDGLILGIAAAIPLIATSLVFSDGGWMNFPRANAIEAAGLSLIVAALTAKQFRTICVGALLCAAGVGLTYFIHSPIGLNMARLPVLLALPILAATITIRWQYPVFLIAALVAFRSSVMLSNLTPDTSVTTQPAYFASLLKELDRQQPIGRVETLPLQAHWEASFVADSVPLARGWLRQLDNDRNFNLFSQNPLPAQTYLQWLHDNGVQYVAVPHAPLSWEGEPEKRLIDSGLPFLTITWSDDNWTLYKVENATSIVDPPGTLLSSNAGGLTFRVDQAGPVGVKIRYNRWLTVSGPSACIAPAGKWSKLEVKEPGTYTISSAIRLGQPDHCRS